jgi:hypothetical protein
MRIFVAGGSMQFMAVDAFAMKNRNPVTAPQQSFADTTSALVANIQHNESPSGETTGYPPSRAAIVPITGSPTR